MKCVRKSRRLTRARVYRNLQIPRAALVVEICAPFSSRCEQNRSGDDALLARHLPGVCEAVGETCQLKVSYHVLLSVLAK